MELNHALEALPTSSRARVDSGRGVLVGARCERCGTTSWPPAAVCRRCGSGAVAPADLGPRGNLVTYARVWVKRPGLEPGYILGQVELGGVRIFAHVRGLGPAIRVPCPVQLVLGEEDSVPRFWFEPEEPNNG